MSKFLLPKEALQLAQALEAQMININSKTAITRFAKDLNLFYQEILDASNFIKQALLIKHGYALVEHFSNLIIDSEITFEQTAYLAIFIEKTAEIFDNSEQAKGTVFSKKIRTLPGGHELDIQNSLLQAAINLQEKRETFKSGQKPNACNTKSVFFQNSRAHQAFIFNHEIQEIMNINENMPCELTHDLKESLQLFYDYSLDENPFNTIKEDNFLHI